MMYCENCKILFEGEACPRCGSEKVRFAKDGDYFFLVEKEMLWGEMLADVFKQRGIPFYFKPKLGAGMAMRVGLYQDSYRFYVPYERRLDAMEVLEELFSADEKN